MAQAHNNSQNGTEGAFNRIPSFMSDDSSLEELLQQEKKPTSSDKASDKAAEQVKDNLPKFLVKYKDEVYNIYPYLDLHPGGRSILEKYENMDISRAFDDINHSEFAKKKLKSFLEQDKSVVIEPVTIRGNKVDINFVKKKLFTKEDGNYVHKTFGFLTLGSYLYRYFYVFPTTGSLGITGTAFDWFTLFLHFMLSFSSMIFHVVEKRIISNPLIIYQEYRLHAIVFTLRAVLVSIFGLYYHKLPTLQARICLSLMLIMIHSTVDYITQRFGTPGITTVRNGNDQQIRNIKLFFAFYQVLAMSSHVIVDENLKDLGFNTLIAIQSSAFLMTLKRKSLIRARTHLFWYGLALVLSMLYIIKAKGIIYCLGILALFALKVQYDVNKYLMWGAFTLGVYGYASYFNSSTTTLVGGEL